MVRTKSLPLAIIVHAINNLIVLLSITFQEDIEDHFLMQLPHNQNVKIAWLSLAFGITVIILITLKKKSLSKSSD